MTIAMGSKESTFYLYKRNMIIRDVVVPVDRESDEDEPSYQVRCCHCPPTRRPWGPYHHTFDTTSHYISHFERRHPGLPRSQEDEKEVLKVLKRIQRRQQVRATRNRWSSAQSLSVQVQVRRRQLNEQKYRRLLAAFVHEADSTFRVVESHAFNKLIKYCNSSAPRISRRTTAADIKQIYPKTTAAGVKRVCQETTAASVKQVCQETTAAGVKQV